MRRKRKEEHENLDRWLLTYADMITLLMAFFIMMYSMSVLNLSRFREAAISIRSGFGGMIKGQGKSVLGSSGVFGPKPSAVEGDTAGASWRVMKQLVSYIESDANLKQSVQIGEDRRGIVITLRSDQLLFQPGRARIRPEAYMLLDKIARTLGQSDNLVQIEGHTCDLRPRGSTYASNWELSTARATNVLRYLVEEDGLPAVRFSAAGCGSARPRVSNTNEANRRKNRRVEIVILRPESKVGSLPKDEPRRLSDPNKAVFQRRLD